MQIWANSYCRSTLAFYEAFAKAFGLPLRICLAKGGLGHRGAIGFTQEEFAHLDIVDVSSGRSAALQALDERQDWHQVFGVYQTNRNIQQTIREAIRRGSRVAIASEAPCNMDAPGYRRLAKDIYLQSIANKRFAGIVAGAGFIINWSGDDAASLQALGWSANKVIPCGYFPPPLLGSKLVVRELRRSEPIEILCTGSMTWHRGPDVLMQALVILKSWGMRFRATFTGTGPLENYLRTAAAEEGLDCNFAGTVPMEELIKLYETCALFVAPGRAEPWGMRVNDALNCGAPSIVSRGLGASKLVFDYGLGATFAPGDPVDLAWQIRSVCSEERYGSVCENILQHHLQISPEFSAKRIAQTIKSDFAEWIEPQL